MPSECPFPPDNFSSDAHVRQHGGHSVHRRRRIRMRRLQFLNRLLQLVQNRTFAGRIFAAVPALPAAVAIRFEFRRPDQTQQLRLGGFGKIIRFIKDTTKLGEMLADHILKL